MALRRHKVRARPGLPEVVTLLLVVATIGFMLAGPVAVPESAWDRTRGEVLNVYRYQNASTVDGRPYRVHVSYRYQVDTVAYEGTWDGEWPEAHSPNALLAEDLERLQQSGFPLVVHYDPENPSRSDLHQEGNRAAAWWLRLAILLAALALWCVFVVYPRMKTRK